jgi:hypothetical protein
MDHQDFKIKPPAPGDTAKFYVEVTTHNKSGLNDFSLRVNPFIQPESYYDNNVFQRADYLNVKGDDVPPILDVTVDGRLLVNGDFVSSSPLITIKLIDESQFNLKQDTIGMKVFLTYPCLSDECDPKYIALSSQDIQWTPATVTSPFSIQFSPQNLPSGNYSLKVEGQDASGNYAAQPYEISFIVEDHSALQILLPFPNPALDRISFGFRLEGGEIPESITFSLYDYTGKSSRSFEVVNAGQFYVGTNYFEWPVPSSLPNGFYLFDVVLSRQGQVYRQHGKLVIQR